MSDWQEIFANHPGPDEPGLDFEDRVFAKIRIKKRQRKAGVAALTLAGAVMLFSLFQWFRPAPERALLPGGATAKEEIPLSEDLFFAASDNLTRYSLEPVAYRKQAAARAATPNQI